jgi:enoyl-CoA hydratase/carnithine racemase
MTMTGQMLTMPDALQAGLVDELVPAPEVVERALAVAEELATLPPGAVNFTRQAARSAQLAWRPDADAVRVMTDHWFSDETQSALRALAERLGK